VKTTYSLSQVLAAVQHSDDEAHFASRYVRAKADSQLQAAVLQNLRHNDLRAQKYFTGIIFANSWAEVYKPRPPVNIANSQRSLDWFLLVANKHADALREHCSLRTIVTRSMLKGVWGAAAEALAKHKQMFGPTLWSLAWEILLIQESRGSELRVEFVETFKDDTFGPGIPIFARFLGLSSDQTLPGEQYRKTIQSCLPATGEVRQFFEMLFFEDDSGGWTTSEQLSYAEVLPLIDRYEFFIRLFGLGLGGGHVDSRRFCRTSGKLAQLSNDGLLKYMLEAADRSAAICPDAENTILISAWDYYMLGNYEESFRLSSELAQIQPENSIGHEILVKSAMYLGKSERLGGTKPLELLWQHLFNVFSKNDNSEDSLSFLQRFGRRYKIPSLTHPFRGLYASHASISENSNFFRRSSFFFGAHSPRNFEYGHSQDLNHSYLKRCNAAFPKSVAFQFFRDLSSGTGALDNFPAIPLIRRLFFFGLATSRKTGSHKISLEYLTNFLSLQATDSKNPLSPFAIEEARRALVDIYRLSGDIPNMQRQVVRAFQERPLSVRRLPMRRIHESCASYEMEASHYIEFPVIVYLSSDEPHEVSFGLRKFMRSIGVDRPSQLIGMQGHDQRTLATLFLRVCTPEVIDSLDSMDTVEKVETERLLLLDWVAKNAPPLARTAETEQLRLTQHSQLRSVLQKIEGARVVINVTALREAEHERFTDAYVRFAAQRDLSQNQTVEEIKNVLTVIRNTNKKVFLLDTTGIMSQEVETFKAFITAFDDVRKAFIYSPHFGIESCLSGRIRHGFVIQHIRKPFVERRLATLRDSAERNEAELFWKSRLGAEVSAQIDQLMEIMFTMTERINAIAEEVRNVWLHSKTESTNSNGLFDYSFTNEELELAYNRRVSEVTSVESFVDQIFNILLERTRESLKTVKSKIDVTLRSQLSNIVNQAISELPDFHCNVFSLQPLRNALAECYQETERTCDQLLLWFQEADPTLMGDVEAELVARTAIGMIEQLNPTYRGKHSSKVAPLIIRGRHFTALVHMVFFLLDNAIRHSSINRDHFQSKVIIDSEDGMLKIHVESQMASELEASTACCKIQATLTELKRSLDPSKVVKEGGSGFAKIIAALQFEFKQKEPRIEAKQHLSAIEVSIQFSLEGVIA
jgi:hypothetical protein